MPVSSQTQRTFLLSFIGSLAACGLVGIYVLLLGKFGSLEARVLGSTAAIGGASILALAAAIAWERRRWHPLGLVALGVVGLALLLLLVLIWDLNPRLRDDAYEKLVASAGILAVALPHTALLALARLRRQYEWVRYGTVGVLGALALLLIGLIGSEFRGGDDILRAIGVLAILAACGTIAVPILHRVSAIQVREAIRTTELRLSLTCPRCGKTQMLAAGRSRCACGLRFNIEIEEEHCPTCGYALYGLTSAVCPECGTPIAAAGGPPVTTT